MGVQSAPVRRKEPYSRHMDSKNFCFPGGCEGVLRLPQDAADGYTLEASLFELIFIARVLLLPGLNKSDSEPKMGALGKNTATSSHS